MTHHPGARRVHRAQSAPDDAFVARVVELTAWAQRHARPLVAAAVLLAMTVLAAAYYVNYRSTLRARAAVRLAEVRQLMLADDPAAAIQEFETFIAQFGDTNSGEEARLLLAELYLTAGQPEDAARTVEALARRPQEPLGATAAALLATAYEAADQLEQAEAVYLRIADDADFPYQRREALDDAARLRLQRGDAAGAAELYQRLLDMTPQDDPDRPFYQLRLGEALAQAGSAASSSGS